MDLMEDYCGARLTHSAVRIGGVPLDIPSDWLENMEKFCVNLEHELDLTPLPFNLHFLCYNFQK